MPVPYTFGTATTSIPLSNLDANFNTPVTIGNTTVGLGNTVTTIGNLTLTNATISTGNVTVTTGIFGAGSNTAPSITTSGDTNTGIFFPAADTIAFTEGGVESLRINSSGNLLVGTDTNPSESQARQVLATSSSAYLQFARTATTVGGALIGTGGQNFIVQTYTGAIGSETYTERMRIDSSGNVGIGTNSPVANRKLTISNTGQVAAMRINAPTGYDSFIEFTENNSLTANEYWQINKTTSTHALQFWNGSERMRIDSSGSLLVGQTTAAVETGSIVTAKNLEITRTVDSNGAALGQLSWVNNTNAGAGSGTSFVKDVACIKGIMDGTGNNSGGYITFETKADAGSRAERMRIDSSGNVGIGASSPAATLDVASSLSKSGAGPTNIYSDLRINAAATGTSSILNARVVGLAGSYTIANAAAIFVSPFVMQTGVTATNAYGVYISDVGDGGAGGSVTNKWGVYQAASGNQNYFAGNLLVGTTSYSDSIAGTGLGSNGFAYHTRDGGTSLYINRLTNDGNLVEFAQANATEGSISVSGSTVSYNGGHLSRWSQWQNQTGKPEVYRGSVLESTNDMCEWNQANEQATKTIVSTTAKSKTVAGVFDMYDTDDKNNPYDFYVAQSGDFIIRISQGVVVENGDLLESAGDGTARPQTDDICRSSTVAKVTSNYVSTTYADGSYCVPCILMIG
jgi:hypothetical protein